MQTLIFNTEEKTTVLLNGSTITGTIIHQFENTPTVKVLGNFYEVMQKTEDGTVPVLRVPISNTNMLIKK